MSGLTGLWASDLENFQEIRTYCLEQERIKLLSCTEPLPEQASARSVA